jgi:tripartite-type tricarboxylate transporter receptor subunit TctC
MKRSRRNFLYLAASAFALPTTPRSTSAQTYPSRPITMVYPFAAGSGGDPLGRVFASRLSELLGQPVLFENVGGAGGMTSSARVAKASPDGYQILLGGTATNAVNQALYKKPLYNAATDFTPVALIADQPMVLIARKDFPAGNLPEFIAYTRANQAKMQYGSAGPGSAAHLACALLNTTIGVEVSHVPYRGGAAALQDLIGGRIDCQCPIANVAMSQIASNTVKALAILSKDRSPALPNLPSAHEQGLSNFEATVWLGLFLPKGTPMPIVQKLHAATIAAMQTPSVQERLTDIGATMVAPKRRSPEHLQKFVESEIERWRTLIKAAGINEE